MDLNKALENLKFDTRMKDFNMKHGLLSNEDVEKYLKALKDNAPDCEEVTLEDKGDFES